MERLKRPESRRMAEPLASVEAFEGFEGQFRATRKKDLARQSPEPTVCATVSHRAQSPQSSKCEVLEQVSKRLRGLRGLRGLKGSFGPLEKKDLARQSRTEPRAHSLASARFLSV